MYCRWAQWLQVYRIDVNGVSSANMPDDYFLKKDRRIEASLDQIQRFYLHAFAVLQCINHPLQYLFFLVNRCHSCDDDVLKGLKERRAGRRMKEVDWNMLGGWSR